MKKIIGLFTAVTLLNSFAFAEFNDINESHWGYNAVSKMTDAKVLSGYPDGSFKPSNNITLAEYASIFSNFFNIKENTADNYFVDIAKTHWAKGKIEAIREYIQPQYDSLAEALNDYTTSTEQGIKPDLPITREIVIYSLNGVLALENSNYTESEARNLFADFDKILYPEAAFSLYKNNIISGEIINGKVYIHPDRYITRAEISSMFAKLLNSGEKISNSESVEEFEQIINTCMELKKEYKLNEAKKYLYDSTDKLSKIDLDNILAKDEKNMINKYFNKFEYSIVDYGFTSYNKAYVSINKKSADYSTLFNNITTEDLTTENISKELKQMVQNYKKSKIIEKIEVINFIKTSDGWKIVL